MSLAEVPAQELSTAAQADCPLRDKVPEAKWRNLSEWERRLTWKQYLYLEILTSGEAPADWTRAQLRRQAAADLGYKSGEMLRRWETKHYPFIRAWQDRMAATAAHPETLTEQLHRLHLIGTGQALFPGGRDGGLLPPSASEQVRAIEAYWKLLEKMGPQGPAQEAMQKPVEEWTDEELELAIQAEIDEQVV